MKNTKSQDKRSLISEIDDMVSQEKSRLEEYCKNLYQILENKSLSPLDNKIIRENIEDVRNAEASLENLVNFVKNPENPDRVVFNEIIKIGGYAFKKSIAARTNLLRHTPTLRGYPIVLDPTQNHLLAKKYHTVDYARGGYILYQLPCQKTPFRFEDHPYLKKAAEEMAEKLYGKVPDLKSMIFTCGLASINTFNDYLRALSQVNGRKNYIGANCWVEIKKSVSETRDPSFVFFDETDENLIMKLLKDEKVQSIALEGIQNYPSLHATDLKRIFSEVKKIDFSKPKYLVIDHVVTFDVNLFQKYFSRGIPKNFCLTTFNSGIKFTLAGWDTSKCGFLIFRYDKDNFDDQDPYTKINDIRAMSGRVPSREEAYLANIETRSSIKSRMARYDRNTEYLAKLMDSRFKRNGLGVVQSAWLPDHKDHKVAIANYRNGGRIMYLKLHDEHITKKELLELYRYIADEAYKDGVPIMAASNFGFSSPHIHIVGHNVYGLSIRISPGSTDLATTKLVGGYIADKVEKFISR